MQKTKPPKVAARRFERFGSVVRPHVRVGSQFLATSIAIQCMVHRATMWHYLEACQKCRLSHSSPDLFK